MNGLVVGMQRFTEEWNLICIVGTNDVSQGNSEYLSVNPIAT
jgi:hypothetical protein